MRQNLLNIAVYPVLLINIIISVVIVFSSHTLLLILVNRLNQAGIFQNMNLGTFSGIQQVINIFGILVLVGACLVAFPLIERYYIQSIEKGVFIRRAILIIGIQLFAWGLIRLLTRLLTNTVIAFDIIALLLAGSAFILIATTILRKPAESATISTSV